jgi:acetylornithine deacetylase/succinyl-diaminopimelate desuccinylase-like protein
MTKQILLAAAMTLAMQAALGAASPGDRAEARDIFQAIVAMKTSEGLGQVPAMAEYLAGKFRAAGFAPDDIHVLPVDDTAALVVRYRGTGKGGKPILLMAHMDVVTAKPEDWQRDPYQLIEEDGYFFGRGTFDIKSEVALLTETFLRLKREKFVPTRDLIIAFTGDEESTMNSANALATRYRDLIDAEFALNGDGGGGQLDDATGVPLLYRIQGAEKSYASFELTLRNPGGHSSEPRADNAIYDLADATKKIQAYSFPVQWNDWTIGGFRESAAATPGPIGEAMAKFAAHPGDPAAAAVLASDPAMIGRTRTTCVATMLRGGHAENALPQSATLTVNCRIFPGTTLAEVKATLQQVVGDKVEIRTLGHPHSSGPSPMRNDVLEAVAKAVHAGYPGVKLVPDMAPYATDGSVYRGAGIPTYGVTALFIKDSEDFAHGLNERVPVASFYAGLDHWYVMLKTLAGR